jgi:hypothetical protein
VKINDLYCGSSGKQGKLHAYIRIGCKTRLLYAMFLSLAGCFQTLSPALAAPLLQTHEIKSSTGTYPAVVNCVTELNFHAKTDAGDPFLDSEVEVVFTEPSGIVLHIPAFWAGGEQWKVRYAPRILGQHNFQAVVTRGSTKLPGELTGKLEAVAYQGTNPLLQHGPVHLSVNRKHFAHADGTPFFWLADSWWHGMVSRLTMDGVKTLVANRVQKGFNTIQFAVAFPCDIAPFDDRGANEAGHAWTKDFGTINPAYWDLTDQRVTYLLEQGLMPSIVGAWGYYINFMGEEKMKKHWRYIVARYGAFPVAWTLCGESRLPWYSNIGKSDQGYQQTFKWAEVGRYLQTNNPTGRLIGIHPGPPLWFHDASYEALPDYSMVDIYFGMGGHGNMNEYSDLLRNLKDMDKFRNNNPSKVSLIGEFAWEGMYGGNCGPFITRMQFWASVLRGSPGHCYGNDAMWQMNTKAQLFGASPMGVTWGNWTWEEAIHWPGASQVSIGKSIMQKFEWWRFEPHQDWVTPIEEKDERGLVSAAAGIPGEVRLFYFSKKAKQKLLKLESGVRYQATFISPIDGKEYPLEKPIAGDAQGTCEAPRGPLNQDWVLVLRKNRN